jgi:hypothetical protein
MQNNCFFELFVPGALGYLNHNVNTNIGLANGTEIRYHSLSFESGQEEEIFREQLENARSGDDPNRVVTLTRPPAAINVELFADFPGDSLQKRRSNSRKRKEWIKKGRSINDRIALIPITQRMGQFNKYYQEQVPAGGRLGYPASQIKMRDHFPLDLGFSVTVYKAQVGSLVCLIR